MTVAELERRLAAIRAEAAARCGLPAYPAEAVAAFDAYNMTAGTWCKLLPAERDRRRDALARARADLFRGDRP